MNIYQKYEAGKDKLRKICRSAEEYDKAMKELIKELGI